MHCSFFKAKVLVSWSKNFATAGRRPARGGESSLSSGPPQRPPTTLKNTFLFTPLGVGPSPDVKTVDAHQFSA
jgi:hypothetical protein